MGDFGLGLGIVLSLDDQFSSQSDRVVSSMGMLQKEAGTLRKTLDQQMQQVNRDFTRNMINLQNLMIAGFSFDQVGRKVEDFGKSVVGGMTKVGKEILSTGKFFETARASMKAFYGDLDTINEVMEKTVQTARETPFEISNLVDSVRSLKAVGSDAFSEYKNINGEMKQLIRYIGDLGAFKPTQGVEGAMFAYREALGGNMRSLKMRFEVNPELIIGRKLSNSSVEQFNKDFVEFVSKLAPNMMENLYGTLDQILSNLNDSITYLEWKLADKGIFDSAKKTLVELGDAIAYFTDNADYDTMNNIFQTLWKPVEFISSGINKIIKWTADLTKSQPMLAKMIVVTAGLVGGLAVLSGALMRVSGSAIVLVASVTSMAMQFQLANRLVGLEAPLSFGKLLMSLRAGLKFMGLFGIAVAGVYYAWKYDMGGIATETRHKMSIIKSAWSNANVIVDEGRRGLEKYGETISSLEMKFAKFKAIGMVIAELLSGSFTDNKFAFSSSTSNAIKNTGIMGIAQTFTQAKFRIDTFFDGFKRGLGIVGGHLKNFLDIALIPFKAVLEYMGINYDGILGFLSGDRQGKTDAYWQNQIDNFKRAGTTLGGIAGTLVTIKLFSKVGSLVSRPFKMMRSSAQNLNATLDITKQKLTKVSGASGFFGGAFSRAKSVIGNNAHIATSTKFTRNTPFGVQSGRRFTGANQAYMAHVLKGRAQSLAPRPKAWRTLFGDRYLDNKGNTVGKFGGLLNIGRSQKQLQLGWMRDMYRTQVGAIKPSDYIGNARDYFKATKYDLKNLHGATAVGSLKNLNGFYGSASSNVIAKAKQAFLRDPSMLGQYGRGGRIDARMFNGKKGASLEAVLNQSKYAKRELAFGRRGMGGNAPVFSEQRGKLMSKLFGNRLFTVDQTSKGKLFQNFVGRRGGVIPSMLGMNTTGAYLANMGFMNKARALGGAVGGHVGGMWGAVKGSRLGMGLGRIGRGVGAGLGFAGRGAGFLGRGLGKGAGMLGKGARFAGRGLMGGLRMGGGLLRGAMGAVFPAMMMASLAKTGWNALSTATDKDGNQVTGVEGAKINLKKAQDAVANFDFTGFWEKFKVQGKELGMMIIPIFKNVFKLINKHGKAVLGDMWTGAKWLAKEAWQWIKTDGIEHLKNLMDWLATDGVDLGIQGLKALGYWLKDDFIPWAWDITVDLFHWFKDKGLPLAIDGLLGIVNWIGTEFLPKAVDWLLGIPEALMEGIGVVMTTVWDKITSAIPDWIKNLFGGGAEATVNVNDYSGGNSRGGGSSRKTSDNVEFRYVGHGMKQYKGIVDGKWYSSEAEAIKHHGGLWMSSNEHKATIRKDETVLPPDISRKFKALFEGGGDLAGGVSINKVEIILKAEGYSQAEARRLAKEVLKEISKLQKETAVRKHMTSAKANI